MATVTFDTHKFIRRLEQAGMSPEQAEAVSEALKDAVAAADVATKGDLQLLRKDFDALEQRLDAKLVQLEQRLTIRLGTMIAAAVALTAALVKLL